MRSGLYSSFLRSPEIRIRSYFSIRNGDKDDDFDEHFGGEEREDSDESESKEETKRRKVVDKIKREDNEFI